MPAPSATYRPRDSEREVLHAVIRQHLETFLGEAARAADGARLPEFGKQEFREFLTCGVLAHGFARVRCDTCAFERPVPFSGKGKGFCPSCGGRRMTERAARLVTAVLPRAAVRQWVLSLPYRLRYALAWDRALCRTVLGCLRAGAARLLSATRATTWDWRRPDGDGDSHPALRGRAESQRALPHPRARRVFSETAPGALAFQATPPPTDAEVARDPDLALSRPSCLG